MKKILAAVLCMLLILIAAGCITTTPETAQQSPVETVQPSPAETAAPTLEELMKPLQAGGTPNELTLGDVPQIILNENRTTGYIWFFKMSGEDILEIVSDEYLMDPNPDQADGVGGTRVITMIIVGPGEASIEMVCKRDDDISQTVTYQIAVPGDPLPALAGRELADKLARSKTIHSGSVMKVKPGQVIRISLDENQSIPYRWKPDVSGSGLVELIQDEIDRSGITNAMPGAGGEAHIFWFEALGAGECTINMNWTRIGEDGIDQTESYMILIED